MTSRDDIITAARGWIGTPFCHQASLKSAGCDCLGVVRGVWRECLGAEPEDVPAYATVQTSPTAADALLAALRRHFTGIDPARIAGGEVLLFRWRAGQAPRHLGIATTPASFIHAQQDAVVCEVAMSDWWRQRLAYAFRFPVRG